MKAKSAVPMLTPAQSRRLATIPTSARNLYVAAVTGAASPRGAIKAMCMSCMCDDRQAVTECTSTACALHRYRPFQRKQGATAE
jgi:hypothetical protein